MSEALLLLEDIEKMLLSGKHKPVNRLTDKEAREELYAITSMLGADHGYATTSIPMISKIRDDLNARKKELRIRLNKMVYQRPYSQVSSPVGRRNFGKLSRAEHKKLVQKALKDGLPVPDNVLKEYDL